MYRSGIRTIYKGANGVVDSSGKPLTKHWMEFTNALVDRYNFAANDAGKRCAEHLLAESQKLVPVSMKKRVVRKKEKVEDVISLANSAPGDYAIFSSAKNKKTYLARFSESWRDNTQSGILASSGRVVPPEEHTRGKLRYTVQYDTREVDQRSVQNNFNYAVIQHENTTFNHLRGEHHFVLKPYLQYKEMYKKWMAEELKRATIEAVRKG
jgi:hypothetical protein